MHSEPVCSVIVVAVVVAKQEVWKGFRIRAVATRGREVRRRSD